MTRSHHAIDAREAFRHPPDYYAELREAVRIRMLARGVDLEDRCLVTGYSWTRLHGKRKPGKRRVR